MLDHWFSHLFAEDARDLRIVDAVDLGGQYDFDDVTVVKNQHGYHVVSTSRTAPRRIGPSLHATGTNSLTYEEALRHVPEEHRKHFYQVEPNNAPR